MAILKGWDQMCGPNVTGESCERQQKMPCASMIAPDTNQFIYRVGLPLRADPINNRRCVASLAGKPDLRDEDGLLVREIIDKKPLKPSGLGIIHFIPASRH